MDKENKQKKALIYAENLKALRKSRNMTQYELADGLKLTQKQVSKYELGKSIPNLQVCQLIAELLSISIDDLAGHIVKEEDKIPVQLHELLPKIKQLEEEHLFLFYQQMTSFLEGTEKVIKNR